MRQAKLNIVANDNSPIRQPRIRKSFQQANIVPAKTPVNPIRTYKVKSAFAWLVPVFAILFAAFAIVQNLPSNILLWSSFVIAALLSLTAARADRDSPLRNVSGLLVVAAVTTGLAALLSENGFTLIGMELALLVSALALFFGWIFKSTPSVLLSGFSGLLYLGSAFPELGLTTGLTDQGSKLGIELVPWIILAQVLLAQTLRSSLVLFTAITAGYIWLGTLAAEMPLPALAGLGFAVAASHYWLGKAWAETGKFGADIHRICAWVIAISAALYIQSIWLNANSGQAKPFWPPDIFWWAVLGASIFSLFVASLIRYKSSHITLPGIFIVCVAVAALPLAMAKPDLVYAAFDTIPGLNANPGLGLIIGAVIIACGFIWLVGGLKNGRLLDMSIGALAIGIEAIVLLQPSRFDADLGVIFVVSLICALCIGGLIAGASPDRSHLPGNYA
jgi:hypothetical protein